MAEPLGYVLPLGFSNDDCRSVQTKFHRPGVIVVIPAHHHHTSRVVSRSAIGVPIGDMRHFRNLGTHQLIALNRNRTILGILKCPERAGNRQRKAESAANELITIHATRISREHFHGRAFFHLTYPVHDFVQQFLQS